MERGERQVWPALRAAACASRAWKAAARDRPGWAAGRAWGCVIALDVCGGRAVFSKKIDGDLGRQEEIGSSDKYTAVCREHYLT